MKKILLSICIFCIAAIANTQTCPQIEGLTPIQVRFASGPQSSYPTIPLYWNRFYKVDVSTGQLVSETCTYTADPNLHEVALCACFVTGTHFRRVTDVCDPTPCGGDLPLPGMPITNNNSSSNSWSQSATWLANQVPDAALSLAVLITKPTQIDADLSFSNGHWLVLSAGNSSIVSGKKVTCNSVIQVYPAAQLENFGTLNGSGQIVGSLMNSGTLSPGNSPGKFTIVGNYTATGSAIHQIEIASATMYDTVSIANDVSITSGNASLNGALNVSLLNGFIPSLGDTYKIFTFTSSTGSFSSKNLPALPNGLVWSINYNPTDVSLKVIAGALPLNFFKIKAYQKNSSVQINWATENEINTSHFDIEKSTNGISFIKTGEVAAFNNSGRNEYTFTDVQPLNGNNYYRLKQVDIDGKYTYSAVVQVQINAANTNELTIYPNPVHNVLQVYLNASGNESIVWQLRDETGKILKQQTSPNRQSIAIDVSGLPNGIYYLVLKRGDNTTVKKFIKQ
jgi:Secretion system C-terminal sorting domain